jgi:hypothetical protein
MLTIERLKEVLHYNPDTGIFVWKIRRAHHVKAGDVAGHIDPVSKYVTIRIDNILYRANILAYFYMKGVFPSRDIDHRDTNRSNNTWLNLRPATRSQNMANCPVRKTNTSGYKGVSWHRQRNKWNAYITVDYKRKSLGYFDDIEKAKAAYGAAALEHFGEFARTR